MLNKIVVFGASGMLGKDLLKHLEAKEIITPSHSECDIGDWSSVDLFFDRVKNIDMVINCAAFVKVDFCEIEASEAFKINSEGPHILAQWCKKIGATLVNISTDYVFEGTQEIYTTEDDCYPQSVYGKSKLIGEQYIQVILEKYFKYY